MSPLISLVVIFCIISLTYGKEETKKIQQPQVKPAEKKPETDLNADSSFGLGYGLSSPVLGVGSLGGLGGYGIGAYGINYGGVGIPGAGGYALGGRSFVIPVYNYGGLGSLGGYALGPYSGNPGGYSNIYLGVPAKNFHLKGYYGGPYGGQLGGPYGGLHGGPLGGPHGGPLGGPHGGLYGGPHGGKLGYY